MEFATFRDGIGGITEYAKLLHDDFLQVGFTPDQAMELTKHMLTSLLRMASPNNPEKKEGSADGTD